MNIYPDGLTKFASSGGWAITPAGLCQWLATFRFEVPATRAAGVNFVGDSDPEMSVSGGVATIPIKGVLIRGASAIEKGWGAARHADIGDMIDAAESDPNVKSILLAFDSPGGTVSGTPELAERIAAITKPCAAFTDGLCASAAFWLACQCDAVFGTTSAQVGAVGTIATVTNIAELLKAAGIGVDIFQSGSLKSAGSPLKTMSPDERAHFQSLVDSQGQMFRSTVRSRRATVSDDAMQGQVHVAADAVHNGLIDTVVSGQSQAIAKMPTVKKPSQPPTREDYDGGVANPNGKRISGQAESEWAASAELRREFASAASYAAFKRAEARGQVKNIQRQVVTPATQPEPSSATSTVTAAAAANAGEDHVAAWHESAELQAEFMSPQSYAAFMRAKASGRIRNTINRRIQ